MLRSAQTIISIALAVPVTGCASSPAPMHSEQAPSVELRGDALVYRGPISAEGNALILEAAESAAAPLRTLVITSTGGDIEAGMELGTWVFERALDVRVPEYCVSSCANYVFTARRHVSRRRTFELFVLVILSHESPAIAPKANCRQHSPNLG